MKKLFLILATAALSLGSFAGNPENRDVNPADKYCAEFKNGVLSITHNGEAVTHDVMLANGSKLHTDGVITNKFGLTRVLKPGECVNASGNMDEGNVENKKANMPVKSHNVKKHDVKKHKSTKSRWSPSHKKMGK